MFTPGPNNVGVIQLLVQEESGLKNDLYTTLLGYLGMNPIMERRAIASPDFYTIDSNHSKHRRFLQLCSSGLPSDYISVGPSSGLSAVSFLYNACGHQH